MKTIKEIIVKGLAWGVFTLVLSACENDIDNYDAPNGGIYGTVVDEQTGDPIPLPVQGNSGVMVSLTEIGTGATAPITFRANQDGTYEHSKVFNGYYRVTLGECPVIGIAEGYVDIKGQTKFDIVALPFSRVAIDASVDDHNRITVHYDVEKIDPSFKLQSVQVMWNFAPGVDINNANYAGMVSKSGDTSGVHTFELLNDREFVENHYKIEANKRRIYVRVAATVEVAGMTSVNYSKVVEVIVN